MTNKKAARVMPKITRMLMIQSSLVEDLTRSVEESLSKAVKFGNILSNA
jgi:hypothetical protein